MNMSIIYKNNMKIVFFWTGVFSAQILKLLRQYKDIEILWVVSQPDKPVGRLQELVATPVKEYALSQGLSVYQPEKLKNNQDFYTQIASLWADFFVVVAYGKLIPLPILSLPKYVPLNIHGSLLPKYRGASPIQEALKNGDKVTWLTIMQMTEWMDTGPWFKQQEIKVDIMDTSLDIFEKYIPVGAELVYETMKEILLWKAVLTHQDQSQVSVCGKIEKEDGHISFQSQSAFEIYNRSRAFVPWPGIYTFLEGKKFAIEKCRYIEDTLGVPGKVYLYWKEFAIACREGSLVVQQVKLEGKKSMDIASFINGNRGFLGSQFL